MKICSEYFNMSCKDIDLSSDSKKIKSLEIILRSHHKHSLSVFYYGESYVGGNLISLMDINY